MANNTTFTAKSSIVKVIKLLRIRRASFEDCRIVVPSVKISKRIREIRNIQRPLGTTTPTERLLFRMVKKAFN